MSMTPAKGEIVPIKPSSDSGGRLIFGLRWDPNEEAGLGDKLSSMVGRNTETFDLDISAYMYNEDMAFMDFVTGNHGETVDRSGRIYHSGDDRDGVEDYDDEQIVAEVTTMPAYIHHIIIIVEIGSAHSFADIIRPEARIADHGTEKNLVHADLGEGEGADNSACVFARLSRDGNGGWVACNICHYEDHEDIEDWSDFLTNFLR